ncbi:hypothetical protein HRG_003642 [Hirsutella rhossiliensis]|uniref:Uncharacterized protein n=1 Tax=Hirsutella rhossiliensis TaxID=111463 RepID=A0A9P8SK68_9HYPO|nr:uncharacterized protein HRG_03642 [Hirsutella rhossiliensis]KAH0965626.1 hypothetical protein HRG_03642 [Hirsutella rhossiliensis]
MIENSGPDDVDFDCEYPGGPPDLPGTRPGLDTDGSDYLGFLQMMRASLPMDRSLSIAAAAFIWYFWPFPINNMVRPAGTATRPRIRPTPRTFESKNLGADAAALAVVLGEVGNIAFDVISIVDNRKKAPLTIMSIVLATGVLDKPQLRDGHVKSTSLGRLCFRTVPFIHAYRY